MTRHPSLITIFCLLAIGVLWLQFQVSGQPPQQAAEREDAVAEQAAPTARSQGQFKPSERIRADSVVAFPADI